MDSEMLHKASRTVQAIKDVNSAFTPHTGQVNIGHELFTKMARLIFVECGRKFGKTELIIYILYRWAMTTPNGVFYYIAPFAKQARELIWESHRIQEFLPRELRRKYIKKTKDQDMRMVFKNGAFIKLDGADNYDAYRGVNPHGIAYEEFKDHRPQFHAAMEPNLATFNAPLVIIGTPPPIEGNLFTSLADEAKREEDSAYFNMPTWTNPHIDKEWLKETKRKLIARGDEAEWLREYACLRVKGSKHHIFGVFNPSTMIVPYDEMMAEIRKIKGGKFICWADPASASCFGILFSFFDPFTRRIYHIDEIYEQDQRQMSVKKMFPKIIGKIREIDPIMSRWDFGYDEAAKWWYNEMVNEFNMFWTPTCKAQNKKDDGLSLIKDQMSEGLWKASDRCTFLRWEIDNYVQDDKGRIPKENDHLIDDMRYINASEMVDTVKIKRPEPRDPDELPRFRTMEHDYNEEIAITDWTDGIVGDL